MIDIEINDFSDMLPVGSFDDLTEVKGITIHCMHDYFTYEEDTAYTSNVLDIGKKFNEKTGFHYVIDENTIAQYVPDNKKIPHVIDGKETFISKAMYEGKPNEHSISILLLAPKTHVYENIERKAVKFIADYLVQHELTTDCIMRGFDLNKAPTPLHLLDKTKWRKFITKVKTAYEYMKAIDYNEEDFDEMLEKASMTYNDEDFRKFYNENGESASAYAEKYEPDHRDIEALVNYKSTEVGEINSFTTNNNTTFTYTVVENSPGSADHCSRAFDTLSGKAEPNALDVEPIYPDIIAPPGEKLTIINSITESSSADNTNVSLSIEELERREKVFNIKDYKDAKKEVSGKPVNNNDPYPVDDKIKELESHIPKVKIDEVNFKLYDCNHPGSVIGPEVAKNFAMVQDEIITLAKRSERRLVKLENIMSTVMRNLFRASSRMQINCTYYGGQDVYGKYKCIRCLHDDRISDGQSMTLDQCLSCTRYEPILGQVYAILDETNTNVSQVLDDLQMGYMSMDEYIKFTRIEELQKERDYANFNDSVDSPAPFSETFEEGFKMDWNNTNLENQKPNIASYETEGLEVNKIVVEKENEGSVEPEFKDAIGEFEASEKIIYNSDDYEFKDFGSTGIGLSAGGLYGGCAQIRNKIVEYAQYGYELGQAGNGRYTMNTDPSAGPTRYNHDDKAINGVHYWDCSSFAEAAYKAAGITSIVGNTSTEYPKCLPTNGGIIIPFANESDAKPGDLVWFTTQNPHPSTQEELIAANIGQIGHVGIYIGNGEYIHASTNNAPITNQIKKSPTATWDKRIFAFGRPQELVEADKNTLNASSADSFDPDKQNLPADLRDNIKSKAQSWAQGVISNNQKWNYAPIFQSVCQAKSQQYGIDIDPYMMMAMSGVEASGDPYTGGPDPGLMQLAPASGGASMPSHVQPGSAEATKHFETQIAGAIDHLMGKRKDIVALCGEGWGTWPIVIYGYNSGQGTVSNTIKRYNLQPMTGGEFAPHIKNYVAATGIIPYPQVRYEYFARILWTYQILRTSI